MEYQEYTPPNDDQIKEAESLLGFSFHPDYIQFIKSGYDMGDSIIEPLEIDNPGSHVDIFEQIEVARSTFCIPESLLPICNDNDNFFCMNDTGEVIYWAHDGISVEKWPSIQAWIEDMQ